MRTKEIALSKNFTMSPDSIAELVQTACKFESSSYVATDGKRINLKSIMGVMSLAGIKDSAIIIEVDGADEVDAATAISNFWK